MIVEPSSGKMIGILGIASILGLAYLMSNNRKAINLRLVISGLVLQLLTAIFVLKVEFGQKLFQSIGDVVTAVLGFSDKGAGFVFGPLVSKPEVLTQLFGAGSDYIFGFRVIPTIIFVSCLVSISYHLGIMQRIVQAFAKVVAFVMGASGSEALSNAASIFVGQVEAQLLIRPYVATMTMSELLAAMSGSMACVAGGVLAVYIGMGIKASYLLTASLMAAPGALVIAKIVFPETEHSKTKGTVEVEVKKTSINLIDAAAHGAAEGLRIGLNVGAMLIAFIALIAMTDACLGFVGAKLYEVGVRADAIGVNLATLKLQDIFGVLFAPVAFLLGVPWADAHTVGRLMGEKLTINEFVAYLDMSSMLKGSSGIQMGHQAETIATFALCGFANFSSIAMQIGGIGEIAPSRRHDLAKLGIKALICGTLASYMSAAIAGLLT